MQRSGDAGGANAKALRRMCGLLEVAREAGGWASEEGAEARNAVGVERS